MRIKLRRFFISINSSLWFIPTLMTLGAMALAFLFIQLDRQLDYKLAHINWFIYGGSPDGARSLLSTIAASMITIAGVVFSITLVALTLASSQFGPRLLRNFINNRANQIVLGTFISTFIYSLIILLAIRGQEENIFVPKISVAISFVFAICSLGVLIFFIHHVASSIQADNVIKSAYKDLIHDINFLLNKEPIHPAIIKEKYFNEFRNIQLEAIPIYVRTTGYIQTIDYTGALHFANENNAVIEFLHLPGNFIMEGGLLASMYYNGTKKKNLIEELLDFIVMGDKRTPVQEIEFGINQLVEIGVRALSPGINDPKTAINCIHWLGAAVIEISKRHFPSAIITDENGDLRIVRKVHTYETIVDTAFDQFRNYGKSNSVVSLRLLTTFVEILKISKDENLKQQLCLMAEKILRDCKLNIDEVTDIEKLEKMFLNIQGR